MKCQGFQRSLALWENVPEEVALEAGDKEQGSGWGHRHSCHHNSRPQIQDSNREEEGPFLAGWKTMVQGREGGPANGHQVASVSGLLSLLHSCHPPGQHGRGRGGWRAGELIPKP